MDEGPGCFGTVGVVNEDRGPVALGEGHQGGLVTLVLLHFKGDKVTIKTNKSSQIFNKFNTFETFVIINISSIEAPIGKVAWFLIPLLSPYWNPPK